MAVVLAAGKGVRMKSDLPKVLVPVRGRPMIEYVLDTLDACRIDRTLVVVGYRREAVEQALAGRPTVAFVHQAQQLGTGHAVMVCRQELAGHDGPVLVVTGDSPMIRSESLLRLLAEFDAARPACILGTAHKDDPRGLGRIVRDREDRFQGIVEEKDATADQRKITEVNLSCYVFHGPDLLFALERLRDDNQQKEYYLTDCPGLLKADGRDVRALAVLTPPETLSINNPEELAAVEAALLSPP
jgi:bifunctional UDP-N-acetylglucosamine pyrophosphorylase/glucosamine-1-phosphate N-acetyltransferase/UDP-N-acetylglucosamine pyrophosphorylase